MYNKLKASRNRLVLCLAIEAIVSIAFVLLIVFAQQIDFIQEYGVYITLAFFIIVHFLNLVLVYNNTHKIDAYLTRSDITIASIFGNEASPAFEFADLIILVYNETDDIIWVSQTTILDKEQLLGQKVYDLIDDFDTIATKSNNGEVFTTLDDKIFKLQINTGLKVVYLHDVTPERNLAREVEENRPFIGHIVIDNFQDVALALGESEFNNLSTDVKGAITDWAKKNNLFIRSYSNDSYLIIGEEKYYKVILDDKFSILDNVRDICKNKELPLTISIGLGKGNVTSLLRCSELSYVALNMALSRGGDQVVVNTFGKPLEYYGAKTGVKQTRSHVRGRVLATSLANLIKADKNVIIMGHSNADFDAIGACLGVYAICKNYSANAYVVYEDELVAQQTKDAFHLLFSNEQIEEMTITPAKAMSIVDNQTLVIVVDTHRAESTMAPRIINKCKEVCVIDHHRKGDVFIENPVFQYHEPQASSASELVTELVYYQPEKIELKEAIATFLLSGISLDTKFFKASTSSKTFEMAMILRNYQASVEKVTDFFKEDYRTLKTIGSIIESVESIYANVYIGILKDDYPEERSLLSKAAEQLLDTRDAKAVFVIGKTGPEEISISARSTTDYNVEIIMKALHGGGHFTAAATQFKGPGWDVDKAKKALLEKMKQFDRDNVV